MQTQMTHGLVARALTPVSDTDYLLLQSGIIRCYWFLCLTHSDGETGDIGEGDCDSHSDCRGDLKCGGNNCSTRFRWGTTQHDCCYEKRCTGEDSGNTDSCCTTTNPCE